jgi:hypothetical protein
MMGQTMMGQRINRAEGGHISGLENQSTAIILPFLECAQ